MLVVGVEGTVFKATHVLEILWSLRASTNWQANKWKRRILGLDIIKTLDVKPAARLAIHPPTLLASIKPKCIILFLMTHECVVISSHP